MPDIARAFEAQAADTPDTMAKHLGLLSDVSSQALTVGEEENERQIRKAAVSAVTLLADVESNRKLIADNDGIMLSLTRAFFDKAHRRRGRICSTECVSKI